MTAEQTQLQEFIQKCFWWLVGIFGTLFTGSVTAVVTVLLTLTGSVTKLNVNMERVFEILSDQKATNAEVARTLSKHDDRFSSIEHEQSRLHLSLEKKTRP
jgi:hypothetical protein